MRAARLLLAASLLLFLSAPARADDANDPAATEAADPTVVEARREFNDGTELVKKERWADALAAFERAAKLKPHAITTYNVAQCERAMGQYTRARSTLVAALHEDEASNGTQLPDAAKVEARALLAELERILPRVNVTLRPADAAVAVDGRPLEHADDAWVAGTLPPGPGASMNAVTFRVVANPGAHVFTVSQRGYQDVVVNKSLAPGSVTDLDLRLDRLPATIHVTSNIRDAIVRVNDADVGNPPVEVSRNAGSYKVTVTKAGFVGYEGEMNVRPGERIEVTAPLHEEKRALTQRWWFWAGAGVLVVGAAVGTYFATRSDPQPTRPATDGGGLGWSLRVP